MKCGSEVRIPTPLMGEELAKFLATYGTGKEVYARQEDGKTVLYLVTRLDDGRGVGQLFASRSVPSFPEEV